MGVVDKCGNTNNTNTNTDTDITNNTNTNTDTNITNNTNTNTNTNNEWEHYGCGRQMWQYDNGPSHRSVIHAAPQTHYVYSTLCNVKM